MLTETKTICVNDVTDLSQVHAADYPEGTLAWVKSISFIDPSNGALYVLNKSTALAANGLSRVRPANGSPVAGNAGSLWIFLVAIT